MSEKHIAHHRYSDDHEQTVADHLTGVASYCKKFSAKVELAEVGELLGLLHDFGKYSSSFQAYILSAIGKLQPDCDGNYVDAKSLKGKIDHSTAGAQWIWYRFSKLGNNGKLIAQMLAVCLASHHGGLLDCLRLNGENGFLKRVEKTDRKTHFPECIQACDQKIADRLEELCSTEFLKKFWAKLLTLFAPKIQEEERLKHFRLGFLTRFLFSCLIDADRIDSADFENPDNTHLRRAGQVDWQPAINRLEEKLASFEIRNEVDSIRNQISADCLSRARNPQGIHTLTVPTGGGKTFSSIRYALHHAHKHELDHIFYIIPYTSIIEQNAQVIREVLEKEDDDFPWVLEHHSNLEPETQTWQSKLSSENWDTPIIFTTMVQFLEVMFGGGTRGARRLHNLANSVIIFDEIQCLPVNCVHLFNNGLQFLVEHCKSTAVLCTATQPLLDGVSKQYGALSIPAENELVTDTSKLFSDLKRVSIVDETKPSGWSVEDIARLATKQLAEKGNCLVIVNTKEWAKNLYKRCCDMVEAKNVYHLSTSLCPAHREEILAEVTSRINPDNPKPVLCISTQLIEAGVDVDFNCVIRFLAGLDSIAQAAGRCNRNGNHTLSEVFIVNPQDEKISMLEDIKIGQEKARRVLSESEHLDFLSPSAMRRYFAYYFYDRDTIMRYPLKEKDAGREGDTLLNLLSDNPLNITQTNSSFLRQSFKAAGSAFAAINAPTQAVIVPHGKGETIIADLCADYAPAKAGSLLRKAQKYSVNVFPNVWKKLTKAGAVSPVKEGEKIYCLHKSFYSKDFGVSHQVVAEMDMLDT